MKQYLKKITVCMLVLAMMAGMGVSAQAATISFSDVPDAHWGYTTIMRMTKDGLFKGTSEPVNGVGTFMPEKIMTRAEFVTAILRAVYPEAAAGVKNVPGQWWLGYYQLALKYGLLFADELENGAMDHAMNRQEMAMVLVRALKINKESPKRLVATSQIADYASIDDAYRTYVRECFSMGLITGVDKQGTFAPTRSLTRAETATVLCRLLYEEERAEVEFEDAQETKPSGTNRPSSGGNVSGGNSGSGSNNNDNPGNNGGSQTPAEPTDPRDDLYGDLTLDEVLNLDEDTLQDFKDWLVGKGETYEGWLESHQADIAPDEDDLFAGKTLEDFTWSDYVEFDPVDAEAFRHKYFDSEEAFNDWANRYIEEPDLGGGDLFAGRELEDFTLEDYVELDTVDQAAFKEKYFGGDDDALFDWLDSLIEEPNLDE